MTQGVSNAPSTFNRCVINPLRPVRDLAPSYFDDVFVYSRAMNVNADVKVHSSQVRSILQLVRKTSASTSGSKFENLAKYHFLGASWAHVLIPKRLSRSPTGPFQSISTGFVSFLRLAAYLTKHSLYSPR